ncbi:DGAT2D [Scenedesmus sp. PABB004]|nr:DGAT2D [Scenedesmus sp. PABB004]
MPGASSRVLEFFPSRDAEGQPSIGCRAATPPRDLASSILLTSVCLLAGVAGALELAAAGVAVGAGLARRCGSRVCHLPYVAAGLSAPVAAAVVTLELLPPRLVSEGGRNLGVLALLIVGTSLSGAAATTLHHSPLAAAQLPAGHWRGAIAGVGFAAMALFLAAALVKLLAPALSVWIDAASIALSRCCPEGCLPACDACCCLDVRTAKVPREVLRHGRVKLRYLSWHQELALAAPSLTGPPDAAAMARDTAPTTAAAAPGGAAPGRASAARGRASHPVEGVRREARRWGGMMQSRVLGAALASSEVFKRSGSPGAMHPIMVNCRGSDEAEPSSSGSGSEGGLLQERTSIASTVAGLASDGGGEGPAGGTPATHTTWEAMQKGHYKTGVRYCMETWPDSLLLQAAPAPAAPDPPRQGLDSLLAMSSMFGYTATLLLIPTFAASAWAFAGWGGLWAIPAWGLGAFVTRAPRRRAAARGGARRAAARGARQAGPRPPAAGLRPPPPACARPPPACAHRRRPAPTAAGLRLLPPPPPRRRAVLLVSVFLPAEPLLWERFQHSTLVSSWRRYFSFSVAIEQKLDPAGKYIFAGFPHGVFPVSELLCISLLLRIWPALRVYSIAASSVFKVPVWRHIMCWTGARPATRRWFRELLGRGSVSLVPGGIAEMFLWEEGREVIKVADRKGFVRIAVESGVPLVPVYHFGNSKLFSWVAPRSWEVLSRRARAAVGYPKGRWGTLMPCNAPLFMAVGAPIPVPRLPRGAPGYEEAVDAAHAAFVKALAALYHKHRAAYGWEDRELVITAPDTARVRRCLAQLAAMMQLTSQRAGLGARPARQASRLAARPALRSRRALRAQALFGGGKEGGGGGMPNPFDMGKLMESVKKAQQLVQVETQRVQSELDATEFDGYDEDETVKVVMNGNQVPKSVEVTQEAIDAGAEELSRRLTTAMQEAHGKSVAGMKDKMKDLAKSLGLPNPAALTGGGGM